MQQQQQQQQQYPQGITLPASHYHPLSTGAGPSTVSYLPKFTEAEKRAMDERLRDDFPGLHEQLEEDEQEQQEVDGPLEDPQGQEGRTGKELVPASSSSSSSSYSRRNLKDTRFHRQLLDDGAATICKNLANGITSVTRVCDYTIRYPSSASTKTCTKKVDVPDDCASRQSFNYPCSQGICKGWTCMYVDLLVVASGRFE